MDLKTRRLFAGCGNKMVAVVNADTGKVIATPPSRRSGCKRIRSETGYVFSSNGEVHLQSYTKTRPESLPWWTISHQEKRPHHGASTPRRTTSFFPQLILTLLLQGTPRQDKPGSFVVSRLSANTRFRTWVRTKDNLEDGNDLAMISLTGTASSR